MLLSVVLDVNESGENHPYSEENLNNCIQLGLGVNTPATCGV